MATLGGHHLVAIFIPHQKRLAESGSGCDQSFSAARFELTGIENAEIFRGEMFDTVARGAQIVKNDNLFYLQLVNKIFGIHHPRKICGANTIFNDRSGDAKTGSFDALARQVRRGLPQKFLNYEAKLRKFLAGKSLFENSSELVALFRKQREITLRTPH